ncbi:MAG: nuclear transport factor 2 family protein [Chloroflexota bacterium]|nr:nuclear transport factor 2 family protein [Chloroflexota bacterium]
MSGGDVIQQLYRAMESGNIEAAMALVHEDFVMEWPQSGERFRGRDNALGALSVQTDRPEAEGEPRIVGSGDVWVVQMRLRYASGLNHYVGVYELRDDKLARSTEYFGAPFPAQEFRARFAEKA